MQQFVSTDGHCMAPDMDRVIVHCTTCDEEYDLPEGMEKCPICGNRL